MWLYACFLVLAVSRCCLSGDVTYGHRNFTWDAAANETDFDNFRESLGADERRILDVIANSSEFDLKDFVAGGGFYILKQLVFVSNRTLDVFINLGQNPVALHPNMIKELPVEMFRFHKLRNLEAAAEVFNFQQVRALCCKVVTGVETYLLEQSLEMANISCRATVDYMTCLLPPSFGDYNFTWSTIVNESNFDIFREILGFDERRLLDILTNSSEFELRDFEAVEGFKILKQLNIVSKRTLGAFINLGKNPFALDPSMIGELPVQMFRFHQLRNLIAAAEVFSVKQINALCCKVITEESYLLEETLEMANISCRATVDYMTCLLPPSFGDYNFTWSTVVNKTNFDIFGEMLEFDERRILDILTNSSEFELKDFVAAHGVKLLKQLDLVSKRTLGAFINLGKNPFALDPSMIGELPVEMFRFHKLRNLIAAAKVFSVKQVNALCCKVITEKSYLLEETLEMANISCRATVDYMTCLLPPSFGDYNFTWSTVVNKTNFDIFGEMLEFDERRILDILTNSSEFELKDFVAAHGVKLLKQLDLVSKRTLGAFINLGKNPFALDPSMIGELPVEMFRFHKIRNLIAAAKVFSVKQVNALCCKVITEKSYLLEETLEMANISCRATVDYMTCLLPPSFGDYNFTWSTVVNETNFDIFGEMLEFDERRILDILTNSSEFELKDFVAAHGVKLLKQLDLVSMRTLGAFINLGKNPFALDPSMIGELPVEMFRFHKIRNLIAAAKVFSVKQVNALCCKVITEKSYLLEETLEMADISCRETVDYMTCLLPPSFGDYNFTWSTVVNETNFDIFREMLEFDERRILDILTNSSELEVKDFVAAHGVKLLKQLDLVSERTLGAFINLGQNPVALHPNMIEELPVEMFRFHKLRNLVAAAKVFNFKQVNALCCKVVTGVETYLLEETLEMANISCQATVDYMTCLLPPSFGDYNFTWSTVVNEINFDIFREMLEFDERRILDILTNSSEFEVKDFVAAHGVKLLKQLDLVSKRTLGAFINLGQNPFALDPSMIEELPVEMFRFQKLRNLIAAAKVFSVKQINALCCKVITEESYLLEETLEIANISCRASVDYMTCLLPPSIGDFNFTWSTVVNETNFDIFREMLEFDERRILDLLTNSSEFELKDFVAAHGVKLLKQLDHVSKRTLGAFINLGQNPVALDPSMIGELPVEIFRFHKNENLRRAGAKFSAEQRLALCCKVFESGRTRQQVLDHLSSSNIRCESSNPLCNGTAFTDQTVPPIRLTTKEATRSPTLLTPPKSTAVLTGAVMEIFKALLPTEQLELFELFETNTNFDLDGITVGTARSMLRQVVQTENETIDALLNLDVDASLLTVGLMEQVPTQLFVYYTDPVLQNASTAFDTNQTSALCCKVVEFRSVTLMQKLIDNGFQCRPVVLDGLCRIKPSKDIGKMFLANLGNKTAVNWSKDDVKILLYSGASEISSDDISTMDDEVFLESLDDFGEVKFEEASKKTAVAKKIKSLVGSSASWNSSTFIIVVKSLNYFQVKDIQDIPIDAIGGSLDALKDQTFTEKTTEVVLARKIKQSLGSTNVSNWSVSNVKKVAKFIKNDRATLSGLSDEGIVGAMESLKNEKFEKGEAGPLVKRLLKTAEYSDPSNYSSEDLETFGTLASGFGLTILENIPDEAMAGAIGTLKTVSFSGKSEAKKVLEKVKSSLGSTASYTSSTLQSLGNMVDGFSSAEFNTMPPAALAGSLETVLNDKEFNTAQARNIVDKLKSLGGGSLKNYASKLGSLLSRISLLDLKDISASDLSLDDPNAVHDLHPSFSQAVLLFEKVVVALGDITPSNTAYTAQRFTNWGRFAAIGLRRSDIANFPIDDTFELITDALAENEDSMMSSQVKEITLRFKIKYGVDRKASLTSSDISLTNLKRVGRFLHHANVENDLKKFSRDMILVVVKEIGKSSLSKVNSTQTLKLFQWALTSVDRGNALPDDRSQANELDALDFRDMGNLLCGISDRFVDLLSSDAVVELLSRFAKCASLTKVTKNKIMTKALAANPTLLSLRETLLSAGSLLTELTDSDWALADKDELASVASNLASLINEKAAIRALRDAKGFREELSDTERSEMDAGLKRFGKYVLGALTQFNSKRRKRSTPGVTCADIKSLGSVASSLSTDQISSLSASDWTDCLETLGAIFSWSTEQLTALASKAKSESGPPGTWSSLIVEQSGSIVAGLSSGEIALLDLSSIDAITSIGKHNLYDSLQLMAGFTRWLDQVHSGQSSTVTSTQLASIGHFACGASDGQITGFSALVVSQAASKVGSLTSCELMQWTAYASKTAEYYGNPVSDWATSTVSDIGAVIGGLSKANIATLTDDQIAAISTSSIAVIPAINFVGFTVSQLSAFSVAQANSVTSAQLSSLSSEQVEALRSVAEVTVSYSTGVGGNGNNNYKGGANGVVSSLAVVLSAVVASLLLRYNTIFGPPTV